MEKTKSLSKPNYRWTSLVCVILGILFLGHLGIRKIGLQQRPIHVPFLSFFRLEPLRRVEFSPTGISIEKQNGDWIVEVGGRASPANEKKIERFLSVLQDLRITVRDEITPLSHEKYGFSGKDAMQISVWGGDAVIHLRLGGVGPLGNEEYSIVEGNRYIYKLSDSLSFYAIQEEDYWFTE